MVNQFPGNSHNNDYGMLLHGWPGCKLLTLDCDTNTQDGINIVKKKFFLDGFVVIIYCHLKNNDKEVSVIIYLRPSCLLVVDKAVQTMLLRTAPLLCTK